MSATTYRRVLLKLSGEALSGDGSQPISPQVLDGLVRDIATVMAEGVQVAIVVGGGNIFRGAQLTELGINRITGDHMGMLATLMNALALRDAFERNETPVRVLSSIAMGGIVDLFNRRKAIHHLNEGRVVVLAGGTGAPLFTTDSAASLRGIEIDADIILKATRVDGVYSADPEKNPDAQLYQQLSYEEALTKELAVMDLAAFTQCRDYDMRLRVFNIHKPGALLRVMRGEDEGTLVAKV